MLYISIRFDLKFAVPVIVAMVHDVLICIGIYALVGREVTSSTVAAILTVLGYSIYDTIIIFDRIRENIPIMRRSSFATIANVSLWKRSGDRSPRRSSRSFRWPRCSSSAVPR